MNVDDRSRVLYYILMSLGIRGQTFVIMTNLILPLPRF